MLSNSWKYIPGDEFCLNVTDGTHDSPKQSEHGKPLITSKHIKGDEIDFATAYLISEQDFHEINKRSKVDQWDVIISMIGAYCGFCFIECNEDIDYAVKNVGLFKAGSEVNAKWLYYYLNSPIGRAHLDAAKSGSTQPYIALGALRNLPILTPTNNDVKKKIVGVLDAIDTKIRVNNRINAELEAMTKTLYDYWFVQFDFPDANGKPYKTSGGKMVYNPVLKREIPEGWEAVSVGKIVDIKTGKEDANYATKSGKYHFFTCGESALKCDDFVFEGKAVLLAGNGSFSVKRYEGKFNAYQRTYVLIPKQDDLFAPLYFAANDKIKTLTSGSRGSIVKFITKGDIEDIYIPLPTSRKLSFVETLNACFSKSSRLYEQNLELVLLRDWLLPMLMNGQVTVE
jgi:type I restriction enzyme S subunit